MNLPFKVVPGFRNLVGFVFILGSCLSLVTGCGQVEKYTNDPPKITRFTVPNEVHYGETVEFRVTVFDPEDDTLTYAWEVSGGSLLSEAGAEVQWTAPELPVDPVTAPIGISVHVSVRDGISEEHVSKSASVIVFSRAFRVAQSISGAYELVRYEVRGDPVEATGTMRLTTTTFTRELRFLGEGENEASEFTSGAFELIAPFDEKKGTISWNADTEVTPTISSYTWDGKLLTLFWPSTRIGAAFQKRH